MLAKSNSSLWCLMIEKHQQWLTHSYSPSILYKRKHNSQTSLMRLFKENSYWQKHLNYFRKKVQSSICDMVLNTIFTAQKMNFSIQDFFSKCNQIRKKLRIWSHLLRKFLIENFIFCAVSNIWDWSCYENKWRF